MTKAAPPKPRRPWAQPRGFSLPRARDIDVARVLPPMAVEMLRRAAETPPMNEVRGTNDRTHAVNEAIRKLHQQYPRYFRYEALFAPVSTD